MHPTGMLSSCNGYYVMLSTNRSIGTAQQVNLRSLPHTGDEACKPRDPFRKRVLNKNRNGQSKRTNVLLRHNYPPPPDSIMYDCTTRCNDLFCAAGASLISSRNFPGQNRFTSHLIHLICAQISWVDFSVSFYFGFSVSV